MIEMFAKLNAKTISLTGGGGQLIDVSDLCGVLASLEDRHSWYIYAMIEQRRAYNMELLHKHFQYLIIQEMRARKFYVKTKEITIADLAYGISRAVVYAHFHHKGKCKECNGIGKKGAEKCKKCEGKGSVVYGWAEKVNYGFPYRDDLNRKWYQSVCGHYDSYVESLLYEINLELVMALSRIKKQALQYRRAENESLFDEL